MVFFFFFQYFVVSKVWWMFPNFLQIYTKSIFPKNCQKFLLSVWKLTQKNTHWSHLSGTQMYLFLVFLTEICFIIIIMMLWVVVVLEVATSTFESWNKVQVGWWAMGLCFTGSWAFCLLCTLLWWMVWPCCNYSNHPFPLSILGIWIYH
jgi:hypothetical protein